MMEFDPVEDEHRDQEIARADSALWDAAVAFLRKDLGETILDIRLAIATPSEYGWVAPYHHGWGTAVRNRLRMNGFGEVEFGIHNLDNIYVSLVEEAVKET